MCAGVCVFTSQQTFFKSECLLLMTERCDSITILQAPVDTSRLPLIKVLCSINLTPAAVLHHSPLKSSLVLILDVAVIIA